MQIEYQTTKKDYIQFLNFHLRKMVIDKIAAIGIFSLIAAISIGGKEFNLWNFAVTLILFPIGLGTLIYLYSFIRLMYTLNKSKSTDKYYADKKTLTTTDDGLNITYYSTGASVLLNWDKIKSVHSAENFVNVSAYNNAAFFIPKRFFLSDTEIVTFLEIVNNRPRKKNVWAEHQIKEYNKPPYWVGWFCLIPLIGAFVGVALILNGIFKYKNTRLIITGLAGIVFTVGIYSSMYFNSRSENTRKGFTPFAQSDLNTLMKNIEFYKMQHGTYPDSLQDLKTKDDFTSINDPIQIVNNKSTNTYYNYKKVGNKYYLFSSGVDGIPNTKDDIYPQLNKRDTAKFGLILK